MKRFWRFDGVEYNELGSLIIPNVSPDIGLSPAFNSWMTFFGQFFDHGLDLVTKGNAGTVYIPLQADDPLIAGMMASSAPAMTCQHTCVSWR